MPDTPLSDFELSADTVEKFAIRCALGNNGGKWTTHYTEEQKDYWRNFVRDLSSAIDEAYQNEVVLVFGTTPSVAH